jgi:peptide/nickel transport system substrate-binding protein
MSIILRVGILSPYQHDDPRRAFDFANRVILFHAYECLCRPSTVAGKAEPVLVKLPPRPDPASPAGIGWWLDVMPGRSFSDGTPVDAAAIARSLSANSLFNQAATAEARGDRVLLRFHRPTARVEMAMADWEWVVVKDTPRGVLGTGPYQFAPDSRPERVRLVRNPTHPGPVIADELHFTVYPPDADGRPSALIQAIDRGEVDFTDRLSRDQIMEVTGVRKIIDPGYCTAFLAFNVEHPALGDPRVRRAFAMNLDRVEIAGTMYSNPLAFVARGLLPPTLGTVRDAFGFRPEQAAALLQEAGFRIPAKPLRLLFPPLPRPHQPKPRAVAEKLAERFGKLGVAVQLSPSRDLPEFSKRAEQADYDLALSGWVPDTAEPLHMLDALLGSRSIPRADRPLWHCSNLARWSNAEMDAAIERYRSENRDEDLQKIHQLIDQHAPLVPLVYGPRNAILSWRVGERPSTFEFAPFLASVPIKPH